MLFGYRIVFPLDHFFGHCAAVFLCNVEKPGICGAFQLDLDGGCLGHGDVLSVQFLFLDRDWNQLRLFLLELFLLEWKAGKPGNGRGAKSFNAPAIPGAEFCRKLLILRRLSS